MVRSLMSSETIKEWEGQFIDKSYYKIVVDMDADVYYKEGGKTHLLFHFRKNVIPEQYLATALDTFKGEAKKASSIRGKASGPIRPGRISPNIDHVVSPGKFRSRVVFKDGRETDYYVSNNVNSLIAGYFDKPKLSRKHQVLTEGLVPCRTTAFTEKHIKQWREIVPLIELCDAAYASLEPGTHREQLRLASLTPDYQISDTAFSTITVNYNWRTACHVDSGDYHKGYSVILVAEEGEYSGGCLGFPQFGICVDIRHGDLILKDPHQYHCNTELHGKSEEWTRLSMVLYYRENMQLCARPTPSTRTVTSSTALQRGGATPSNLPLNTTLVPVQFPKRDIDLQLYIRRETSDETVIDEVLKRNVYEKPKLNFFVNTDERWLDLGGNIGTFALLALAHGASVVTCEPEPDNITLLNANLELNFPGGNYEVLPYAVTTEQRGTVQLYLCKGDYNKYRHTIYPKRGRSSITVKQVNIKKLLQEYRFDAIKMDIEGAEIDILEYLTPRDYQAAHIRKMVYEYSFDIDPSIPRFLRIIETLRQYFDEVHYSKVKEDELEYKHFPAATMVYCLKRT